MRAKERHDIQERFMRGELKAIVATNAFGMGIDKPDIRFVIHYDLPGSIDAYYQESGRAGRDGEDARCALLFRKADQRTHLFFMGKKYPRFEDIAAVHKALAAGVDRDALEVPGVGERKLQVVMSVLAELGEGQSLENLAARYEERQKNDREKLDSMIAYAQSALCRWQLILRQFGESIDEDACGDCDNCRRAQSRQQLPAAS